MMDEEEEDMLWLIMIMMAFSYSSVQHDKESAATYMLLTETSLVFALVMFFSLSTFM